MLRHVIRRNAAALLIMSAALGGCGSDNQPSAPESAPETKPAAAAQAYGQIDREKLLTADAEPGNWMTRGRDFGRSHHSPLTQVNRDTVARLGFAWEYRTNTNRGLEATPIVVDGVMYTSGVAGRVYALDAGTGAEIWAFDPRIDYQVTRKTCCDEVNRGVAIWQGKVYVASLDGRLFALDAATGKVLWETDTIVDHTRGYSSTGAPEIAGNVVVIGNAGSELDARGYVSAYALDTGALAWRFYIVPGDPKLGFEHPELELAAKTWDPNSLWEAGLGGTPWDALIYDPELNLLYVGTGNAALWSYHDRSPAGGDNLFLTSILAINPDTGRLVWHFQQVPGDRWDYTATQPIILANLNIDGRVRKVLMQAPKNGYFYILDRETGEFLSARNYVPVSWGHVDPETGKGIVDEQASDYGAYGPKLVFPSAMGGHNWHPMAYSPETGLVYIPTIEAGMVIYDPTKGHDYRRGLWNTGVTSMFSDALDAMLANPEKAPAELRELIRSGELTRGKPDPKTRGLLRAWDPIAGKTVWEFETAGTWDRAGALATSGGLVFHGDALGRFRVYDAANGKLLKDIDVGSTIMAAPMTYAVDGVQYVAVMAAWGGGGWSSAQPTSAAYRYGNQGRLLAFKLDGGATPKPELLPEPDPIPEPPAMSAAAEIVQRGERLFGQNCRTCHSMLPGGPSKDLRRMNAATHANFDAIVRGGAYKALGMPQWDDVLNADDAEAIRAYLIKLSWDAYRAQN
jgi:quinohemoprotein ethanol dehydrogenase